MDWSFDRTAVRLFDGDARLAISILTFPSDIDPGGTGPVVSGRYAVIGPLGRGGYGTVYKARDTVSGDMVALKRVRIFDPLLALPISFTRENTILQTISHPNIIRLNDIVRDGDGSIYMALEYCEFDLSGLIHLHGLSTGQIQSYMGQLLSAVAAMHSQGFVHRDLKPANVFVTRAHVLKLGDFGLSKCLPRDSTVPLTQNVVTPSYRAPELLLGAQHYGFGVDVWSLGCVLFEMITGQRLFEPTASSQIGVLSSIFKVCGTPTEEDWPDIATLPGSGRIGLVKLYHSSLRETLIKALPTEFHCLIELFEEMLQLNPNRRITVQDALAHPFFRECVPLNPLPFPECHAMDIARQPIAAPVKPPDSLLKPTRTRPPLVLP
jgi:serine/threonine protein kinase